jgi:hypothetical protein
MARSHLLKALMPARVSGRRGHRRHGHHSGGGSNTNTNTSTGTSTRSQSHD